MKKLSIALTLALLSASFAGAADITLKDGRTLREAVVIKQDAATVTFRHSAGFSQIEKTKLPEPLATEYPLDTAMAEAEAQRQWQEISARRAEAERLFALRQEKAAALPAPTAVFAAVEPTQRSTNSPSFLPLLGNFPSPLPPAPSAPAGPGLNLSRFGNGGPTIRAMP